MLFQSPEFLFLFLPVVVLGIMFLQRRGDLLTKHFMLAASWFFYAWWDWRCVFLFVPQMLLNFHMGTWLRRHPTKRLLSAGIALNLGLIGYFKYTNFFLFSLASISGHDFAPLDIVLPIGISFYTFQQIEYLMDCYRQEIDTGRWIDHSLYISFFPHLVAGPIVYHRELVPQFRREQPFRCTLDNVFRGFCLFSVAMAKKCILADGMARIAEPVFRAAQNAEAITTFDAWTGMLAFAFQLYFDFSAYSDMAVALAVMFGIVLPINFSSPYTATNISEFWRRWHITLSRLMRDYLYLPLGGSRVGPLRQIFNLVLVMFIGGLWHGAAWTFVLWGVIHGLLLVVYHLWSKQHFLRLPKPAAWALTFLAVCLSWVIFRADSMEAAGRIYASLMNFGQGATTSVATIIPQKVIKYLGYGFAVCLLLPRSQTWMESDRWWGWKPNLLWALACGVLFAASLLSLTRVNEFLYFQF